ncbi:hypothetical protein ACWGNN_39875 [Streptomyces sp. NPDC055817]
MCSFFGCGQCWYCQNDLWSLCDNANTNPGGAQDRQVVRNPVRTLVVRDL